jgi:hypothetical protein
MEEMNQALFQSPYLYGILEGLIFGIVSRLSMLRTDYRQYPTQPHGKIIHISLGVIAAGLGAIAVPALLEKNYTAVTFLSLAAQQFRDVRKMERETLTQIDHMELVPRGTVYIEGIAMVFEGRNYLVIFTSLVSTLFCILFTWYWGIVAGLIALFIGKVFMAGKTVSHIADIQPGQVIVKGADLYVDDIYIMNVGLADSQNKISEHGMGLIFNPKNKNCRVTLSNLGQRQAILHDLSNILGVYRDSGDPSLVPMAKLDLNDGRLGVFFLPQDHEMDRALIAAGKVPVLESTVRMPSESKAGRGKAEFK